MAKKPDKKKHSDIRIPNEDIRINKDTDGFKSTLTKVVKKDERNEKE